jgi:hypothetical protein
MKHLLLIFVLGLSLLVTSEPQQSVQCGLCRQIFTALIKQVGQVVSEDQVDSYLRFGCAAFGLDSWCQINVYPNEHDIFLALRSNKTDDIICERIGLCHFRVISITGNILFAEGDNLYIITERPDGNIVIEPFGTVYHPSFPAGIISGLACSVDYCAVLLSSTDPNTGVDTYGTVALSYLQQIDQVLPRGVWYGPWHDIITDEFWMASGSATDYTFGIFDPSFGDWEPKVYVHLPRARADSEILSGQILDRVLYFTIRLDPHIYKIDLALRIFRGNFTTPNDTMIAGNPITNELYGYSPSPIGVWKYNSLTYGNRTVIVPINLSSAEAVPSSTVNPIDNTLWISLWGGLQDAWLKIDLATNTAEWAPTGNLDGLFDFNPITITTEEV